MNIQQYVLDRKAIFNIQDANKECTNLLWASNSLFGEGGEYANLVKKVYRDHGTTINSTILNEMALELGDYVWYWVFCCETADIDPIDIMKKISFDASYLIKNDNVILASNALGSKIGKFQDMINYIYTVNDAKIDTEIKQVLFNNLHTLFVIFLRVCQTINIDPEMTFEMNLDKLKKRYNL